MSKRNIRTPNEIILYDDYAEIILYNRNNEKIATTQIDKNNINLVKNYKWYFGKEGYVRSGDKPIYLHRIILNCDEESIVDHIDGNPLNNRLNNLRVATFSQNMMNRRLQSNNSSGVTGVVWHKQKEKWQSQIKINNKNIFLGRYNNIESAIKARKDAEIKYFGEFIRKD